MVEVVSLKIPAVKLIRPRRFSDARGYFSETYNRAALLRVGGIDIEFCQDNQSYSIATGTLRGLHFQTPPFAQDKLFRVLRGAVLDVAVDLRVGSPSFGRHVAEVLSAENGAQLLIPIGFAHGFVTLEPDTEVHYKTSAYYSPAHDKGVLWNDPVLGVDWRLEGREPILSDKDKLLPRLADLPDCFTYEE